MRLTAFTFLFNALLIGFVFWLADRIQKEYGVITHYKVGLIFPLFALIFLVFANRAIKKDEEKVKAADRLR